MPQKVALVALILLCMFSGFQNYPTLLGGWEASTVAHTFAPEKLNFDFRIHRRANIGGYEYAALDVARRITKFVGYDLRTVRLPSILYGFFTIFLVFVFTRRWFGPTAALLASALLASNQVFLHFQHQLIIVMPSMACLMLALDRYQCLTIERGPSQWKWSVITFGAACALTALHYGPARLYMLALWPLWLINKRTSLKHLAIAGCAFLISLSILDWRNGLYFFDLKSFLWPTNSESARNGIEILQSLNFNLPLTLAEFTGSPMGGYFSDFSSDLLVDSRYRLVSVPVLGLFLTGLFVSFRDPKTYQQRHMLPLLGMTLVAPLLSSVIVASDGSFPTFSTYRACFAIIPISIYAAIGGSFVIEQSAKFSRRGIYLGAGLMIAVVAFEVATHQKEVSRFTKFVKNYSCHVVSAGSHTGEYVCGKNQEVKDNDGHYALVNLARHGEHAHYNEQIALRRTARALKKRAQTWQAHEDKVIVFDVPVWHDTQPWIHHYANLNYQQIFLAFYLGDIGVDTGYIQFYSTKEPNIESSHRFALSNLKQVLQPSSHWNERKARLELFLRTSRKFSDRKLPLAPATASHTYVHQENESIYPIIRNFKPGSSRYILVTMEEGRNAALEYLAQNHLEYEIVRSY